VVPLAYDPLQSLYEERVNRMNTWWSSADEGYLSDDKSKRLHDRNLHHWHHYVSMLGSLAGSISGGGNPWAAASTLYGSASVREVEDFARVQLRIVASLALEEHRLAAALRAAALGLALQPPPPPLAEVRETLLASLEEGERMRLVGEHMETVKKEIERLKDKPAEIDAWLAKNLRDPDRVDDKTRPEPKDEKEKDETVRLKHAKMPQPLTLFEAEERLKERKEPALQPLMDLYLQQPSDARLKPEQLVQIFLGQQRPVYAPQEDMVDRTRLLFWYTQDLPAKQRDWWDPDPTKRKAVRDAVLESWKFDKARDIARHRAEEIAAEIKDKKLTPELAERILREVQQKEKLAEPFILDRVAQLNPPEREVHAFFRREYVPYQVPEDKREQLPYPPESFVKDLLDLHRPGDATVVEDRPVRTFYVPILLHRLEPTLAQFADLYKRTPLSDQLYDRFVAEHDRTFQEKVLKQLRKDAGTIDKDGRFAIPEHLRRKSSESVRDFED
jgi:hypothetical protein